MVAKGDGLGALQVGIARHYCPGEGFGLDADSLSQFFDLFQQALGLLSQIEPDIQRHLIVPASGGMQPFTGISQPAGQFTFHESMDILLGHVDFQRPGL